MGCAQASSQSKLTDSMLPKSCMEYTVINLCNIFLYFGFFLITNTDHYENKFTKNIRPIESYFPKSIFIIAWSLKKSIWNDYKHVQALVSMFNKKNQLLIGI